MADNEVEVKFGADTDGLNEGISAAKKATEDLSSAINKQTSNNKTAADSFAAVGQQAASAAGGLRGLSVGTAGATREFIVLGHEIISGNFSRIPGSILVLAERMGGLHDIIATVAEAVNPMTLALGAAAVAAGVLGYNAMKTEEGLNNIHVQMDAVGDGFNYNKEQMKGFIDELSSFHGISKSEATAAFAEIASQAILTGDQFEKLIPVLANLTTKFNGDTAKAAQFLGAALANPAKAIDDLDQKFHAFTPEQLALADKIRDTGTEGEKLNFVIDAMNSKFTGLYADGLSSVAKGFIAVYEAIKSAAKAYEDFANQNEPKPLGKEYHDGNAEKNDQLQQNAAINAGIRLGETVNTQLAEKNKLLGQQKVFQDALAAATSKGDYTQIEQQQANLDSLKDKSEKQERSAQDETLKDKFAGMDAEMTQYKSGSAERIELIKKELQEIIANEGQKGNLYRETMNKLTEEQRAAAEQGRQVSASELDETRQFEQQKFQIKEQNLNLLQETGEISSQQELAQLIQLKAQEYQVELTALQNKLKLYQQGTVEYQRTQNQITLLAGKAESDRLKLQAQAQKQSEAQWKTYTSAITQGFTSGLRGMINGTQTWQQTIGGIFENLVFSVIDKQIENMVDSWIAGQVKQTLAQQAGDAARLSSSAAAATAGAAAQSVAATTQIQSAAAQGAASTYASIAAIPIVGPVLAPAAAAVAYGAITAFGGDLPSFAVGSYNVPSDTLANVHAGEMIVPKNFANQIRQNGFGGGGGDGGGGDIHIHAVDAQGIQRLLMNNGGAVAKTLHKQKRNFSKWTQK